VTTFYLPLCFILVLYWRIYQAARKRINKRKVDSPIIKNNRRKKAPKNFSAAKFRFSKRNKIPKDEWDSSQNSEAVSRNERRMTLK
jgi:cbb3-type cytochrome oxidase subunit 3